MRLTRVKHITVLLGTFYRLACVYFCKALSLTANLTLRLSEKLSKAVAELSEDNAKAISKGLFRYAVELEMITRIIAQITDISDRELDSMRAEAINNVRRTRGKVHLDEILKGYYNDR